ncbi:MAG: hypothetical protein FJX72_11160 [Armatimonadetes bacterium]|nr:hypothetical protein [Armatimonadota bacterium]
MDPITTLAGPVNAAAFVDQSSTASGAAVMAEVAQLLNKTNEVIGGLTTVASDLDAAEVSVTDEAADRASADAEILVEVAQLGSVVEGHTTSIGDHENRIVALEGTPAGSYGTVAYIYATESLTYSQCLANRVIVASKVGGTTAITIRLPIDDVAQDLQACPPITIINDGLNSVALATLGDQLSIGWGDGSSGEASLTLDDTEWITVMPVASRVTQDAVEWFIIGGKSYSDLAM